METLWLCGSGVCREVGHWLAATSGSATREMCDGPPRREAEGNGVLTPASCDSGVGLSPILMLLLWGASAHGHHLMHAGLCMKAQFISMGVNVPISPETCRVFVWEGDGFDLLLPMLSVGHPEMVLWQGTVWENICSSMPRC